jgi:hypothetical protein
MKKLFAVLCIACMVVSLSLAAVAADKANLTGVVTDEKCAKGPMATDHDCAAKCIGGGGKAVFVNDKDKSVWPIDNPDSIKGHEGHHVTVSGSTANNTLHIDSLKMAAGGAKGKGKGGAEHKM